MDLRVGASASHSEIALGDLVLKPGQRLLEGPRGSVSIEPLVVQVLQELSQPVGEPVSRQALFDRCWGSLAAGDDSLNRTIYQLRRALEIAGSARVKVSTVRAQGYVLEVSQVVVADICARARKSWRMGLVRADHESIGALRSALASGEGDNAKAWGLLALLCCRAAEYEPAPACIEWVHACEEAAGRALALDPAQADARVALSSLRPLYGDWSDARRRLLEVLEDHPDHFPARHELAVLEMSTGRVAAAVPMIEGLLRDDPLAATLHYKRGYHLFCLGRHDEMDRVLDNALQTWPGHPGIWMCRNFTFAFTGRAAAAMAVLEDEGIRPPMPPDTLAFHRIALAALADGGESAAEHAAAYLADRTHWQSMAVPAAMYLCALGRLEQAVAICQRYYMRDGDAPVRLRHEPGVEANINEMHRRATQMLFLPVTAQLRDHPAFPELCARMGLADYWEREGLTPDFAA